MEQECTEPRVKEEVLVSQMNATSEIPSSDQLLTQRCEYWTPFFLSLILRCSCVTYGRALGCTSPRLVGLCPTFASLRVKYIKIRAQKAFENVSLILYWIHGRRIFWSIYMSWYMACTLLKLFMYFSEIRTWLFYFLCGLYRKDIHPSLQNTP